MEITTERFDRARERIRAGDADGLAALLAKEPELVRARRAGAETHYEGYFHRPTLLHHLAGNPLEVPVPANACELARVLLDRGAEVDAVTDQGPAQPNDVGWTTLGLAATSSEARASGVQRELCELLVARGADVNARRGGALMGALYYGETEAAAHLVELGADVDLVAAAGLGRLDLVERHLARAAGVAPRERELTPDAHRLVHYSLVPLPARESRADVLALALCYAAKGGHTEVAERLIELGADVDARAWFDHRATPLHWAVLGDRPDTVRRLLDRGADPELRDASFDSTPAGWARHLERARCAEALETNEPRRADEDDRGAGA